MFLPLFVLAIVGGGVCVANPVEDQETLLRISVVGMEVIMAEILYSNSSSPSTPFHVYGKATWFMSQEACSKNGMKLVRINDQNKNEDVVKFVEKLHDIPGPFWTQANKLYDGNTWAFSMTDPVKYFHWANGEPTINNGDSRDCVEIHKDGQWYNRDCSVEQFILCEKKMIK